MTKHDGFRCALPILRADITCDPCPSSALHSGTLPMIPFSVLDLAPITEGSDAGAGACATRSTSPACRAAGLSAATGWPSTTTCRASPARRRRCVIGHVAGGTSTIRVGAGGIMLPNHAPLVIAEQFGTLESLYPGPHRSRPRPRAGHRPAHRARAAPRSRRRRRQIPAGRVELQALFRARRSRARRSAPCPARARTCRSGSSAPALFGAQLAAMLGLPFAFASHFAPDDDDAGAGDLPRAVPAVGAARQALCDGRRQRVRRRHRRGGAAAVHLAAAGVRQSAPRHARASCRRRSTTSSAAGRRPRSAGVDAVAGAAPSSARPTRCARGLEALRRATPARTS